MSFVRRSKVNQFAPKTAKPLKQSNLHIRIDVAPIPEGASSKRDPSDMADQLAAQERFDRLSQLGSGVIGLMGGSPARTQIAQTPQASPLASALGIGSTLAGIYGALT